MKTANLKHLQLLAYEAYAGLVINPQKTANSVINEFTTELNDDIRRIRSVATPAITSNNLEAIISKYHRRYEFHLTAWLQSSIQNKSAFTTPPSASTIAELLEKRKGVRDQYNFFRRWRQRTVNMITKSMKRAQIQEHPNRRNRLTRILDTEKETRGLKRR